MQSDEEIEDLPAYRGIPGTIILINCYELSRQETVSQALIATCSMLRQYLRQSSSQCVGVSLFGIEDTYDVSRLSARSVVDVFPLSLPTLDDFKKLQEVNISNIKPAKELVLSDVLLHSSKMFANCKKLLSIRTIVILSRLETPPIQTDQKPALKRVEDLIDSNIDLRLINIGKTEYDIHEFYKDFLLEANKGRDIVLPKPLWCDREIEKLMYQQSHRHSAVAKISFEIGNGMNIGVGVYSLMKGQGQIRQKTSALDRETNAVLTSVTKTMKVTMPDESGMDIDGENQDPKQVALLKTELLHYQEYGGERVEFTDDEMKVLKNPFGPPILKLLGFKPATLMCKEKWYLKKSYFLFPNESIIEGSTVAFKALHQACIETGMVAICILSPRVNARPINVALSPSKNPLGLDIDIGFDVICIPFIENVRNIPNFDEEEINITHTQKTVMKDIIKSLQFDYKAEKFENPMLQSKYRIVEAIALHQQDVQPFYDTTKPNSIDFQEVQDELFNELFGPFGVAPVKRPTPSNSNIPIKKLKNEEIDESLLLSRIASGKISQYTVPDLKKILKSKDIPNLPALTGLHKAELVDLVHKNFQ